MSAVQVNALTTLAVCLLFVLSAVIDLRRGWVTVVMGSSGRATRDATPILYWIMIAFKLGVPAVMIGLQITHGAR